MSDPKIHKPGVVCYQCPECKMRSASDGYRIGVTDGERLEREAIVAWLRKWAGDIGYRAIVAWLVVIAIERGEHLRGDDE